MPISSFHDPQCSPFPTNHCAFLELTWHHITMKVSFGSGFHCFYCLLSFHIYFYFVIITLFCFLDLQLFLFITFLLNSSWYFLLLNGFEPNAPFFLIQVVILSWDKLDSSKWLKISRYWRLINRVLSIGHLIWKLSPQQTKFHIKVNLFHNWEQVKTQFVIHFWRCL